MAAFALPAFVKIEELRVRVAAPNDEMRRPSLGYDTPTAPYREGWEGSLVIAPMSRENLHALIAFLGSLDGRVNAFYHPATIGVFNQAQSYQGTLGATAVAGSETLTVNFTTGAGTTLRVGTLLRLAPVTGDTYQLFQVVREATAGTGTIVYVAPRPRRAFTASTAVNSSDIAYFKWELAHDRLDDVKAQNDRGAIVIPVREATG